MMGSLLVCFSIPEISFGIQLLVQFRTSFVHRFRTPLGGKRRRLLYVNGVFLLIWSEAVSSLIEEGRRKTSPIINVGLATPSAAPDQSTGGEGFCGQSSSEQLEVPFETKMLCVEY